VNLVNDKVVRHLLAYLSVQKWFAEDVPFYVKIWLKLTYPFQKTAIPIIVPQYSPVAASEKKFN